MQQKENSKIIDNVDMCVNFYQQKSCHLYIQCLMCGYVYLFVYISDTLKLNCSAHKLIEDKRGIL